MVNGNRPTPDFRREAVRLALTSGRTRREIAEDLGIGLSTLTRWLGQERDVREPREVPVDLHAELKRLRRENAVLKQERDILKKGCQWLRHWFEKPLATPSSREREVDDLRLHRSGEGQLPARFSRIVPISWKLLETLQMAVAGCFLGLLLAIPFAILATDRLSPHPVVRHIARAVIALFRTVPDLVWAIIFIFIIIVGLGPAAGVMAIMLDKIGFAGRFFAEAMEETDPGPQDALRAIGASRLGIIVSSVFPACLPSFTATSLFALEKISARVG